ncbi:serine hydrolase domain-containing protein [Blastopirellula marina]|uniref:Serine hydrolase n=1 Tax=Blastopirellula marina TaxID=124 RepID=A0A2S8G214_9BACT|nr:serine hydrolase domain-containing protein [Blastopirellula marina]PQO38487.1 serine hydrolase [Blastopirellula marina]PTL45144.1 serine hydrolase [Blastopirellula marina]
MYRRHFLQWSLAVGLSSQVSAADKPRGLDEADKVLKQATASGQVKSATLHVLQRGNAVTRAYGVGTTPDSMFLLGSISKPICVTALMRLYDQNEFQLDDKLSKYLPKFTGQGRENVTLRHVLTHTSGLPDQLANNADLRRSHAGLEKFVEYAQQEQLSFVPGSNFRYSSMGILLATHVAEKLTGKDILSLVEETVFKPLKMERSAQGLGRFSLDDMVLAQTEFAAPESGSGDPTAKNWDWNSLYWRKLGAPWGTTHCSAPDVAKFLSEYLFLGGTVLKPETARLVRANQNPTGIKPRGIGFDVGPQLGGNGCSSETFGHTGSTGTLAWADPATETICVVLTSLPGRAVTPHPRQLASEAIAAQG